VFQDTINKGDIPSTLKTIIDESAKENDIILVCGSFYIMADVREYLKYQDEYDHKEVNFGDK
jgi:folylpolyglutamate synthase/dihydropteroate synthase